jgi:hypothetical protein
MSSRPTWATKQVQKWKTWTENGQQHVEPESTEPKQRLQQVADIKPFTESKVWLHRLSNRLELETIKNYLERLYLLMKKLLSHFWQCWTSWLRTKDTFKANFQL